MTVQVPKSSDFSHSFGTYESATRVTVIFDTLAIIRSKKKLYLTSLNPHQKTPFPTCGPHPLGLTWHHRNGGLKPTNQSKKKHAFLRGGIDPWNDGKITTHLLAVFFAITFTRGDHLGWLEKFHDTSCQIHCLKTCPNLRESKLQKSGKKSHHSFTVSPIRCRQKNVAKVSDIPKKKKPSHLIDSLILAGFFEEKTDVCFCRKGFSKPTPNTLPNLESLQLSFPPTLPFHWRRRQVAIFLITSRNAKVISPSPSWRSAGVEVSSMAIGIS